MKVQTSSASTKSYVRQMNAIKHSAQALRQMELEADRKMWAERSARLAAGKAVTFSLKVR